MIHMADTGLKGTDLYILEGDSVWRHVNTNRPYVKKDSEGKKTKVVGAQAANELLNIIGIKASFVLTEYAGKIYISSRSIDEINVQLIMERLGGGGHLNVAGAQLTGCTMSQAKHKIMSTLDEMRGNYC